MEIKSSVVLSVIEICDCVELVKKAESKTQFGGPPAVQFVPVFQFPVAGAPSHVAVPALAGAMANNPPRSDAHRSDTCGIDVMLNQWGRLVMGCRKRN